MDPFVCNSNGESCREWSEVKVSVVVVVVVLVVDVAEQSNEWESTKRM